MINVGVIGAGFIGPIHLEALARLPGIRVAFVADVDATRARQAAADHGIEHWCSDWREVVRNPDIHVIHNCTPNKHHFEINREAIVQGKHVFSEKPLCMTLEEAEQLVHLAKDARAVTGIGFCYRYYPAIREMAARVQRGDAGVVRFVTGTWFQDWLSRETDWSWRLLREESGDSNTTADLGSHWFDLIQFVTGLEVKEVLADLATLIPVRQQPSSLKVVSEQMQGNEAGKTRVELEDYSSVLFHLSSGAPGSFTTSQVCAGRKSDTELQVYGGRASYAWNHKEATVLWIGHRDRPNEMLIEDATLMDPSTAKYANLPAGHPLGYHDAMVSMFRDYYSALQGDGGDHVMRPTFATGLDEMRLLRAILASHEEKRWVEVIR